MTALLATLLAARNLAWAFWLDELWLVRYLTAGLVPDTPVPPLFVVLGRAIVTLSGPGEAALRVAALAGFALLVALPAALPRRRESLCGAPFALAWSLLLALSSPLLVYAAQLKQYTWEAALGAGLLVGYLHFERNPGAERPVRVLSALAVAAPLVATPAPFLVVTVLGAAGLRLAALPAAEGRRSALRWLIVGLVGSALTTLLVLFLAPSFVAARANPRLGPYWETRFWDGTWSFFWSGTRHWLGQALNLTRGGLLALGLASTYWLARGRGDLRRRSLFAALCTGPPALALAASAFDLYPYGEVRLLLFAVPGALALLAAGVATAIERRQWLGVLAAGVFGASFALHGAVRQTYDSTYLRTYDGRPTIEALAAVWRPGDQVVATPDFVAQLAFYRPEVAAAATTSEGLREPAPGERVIEVLDRTRGESSGGGVALRVPVGRFELLVRERPDAP